MEEISINPLYQITVSCLQCGREYSTSKVRPSFKKAIRRDSDFCTYYKPGNENPDFYVARVCLYCGYTVTENFTKTLHAKQREVFSQKIGSSWNYSDFGGIRTIKSAMVTYKLALLCSQIACESDRVIAGLLHHIAWLHRYEGNAEEEARFLQFALDAYIRVYETEQSDLNNARLLFMIGELCRRLKQYHEAVRWFGRVINDTKIMDAGMIRACREGWAATREDMAREQMEFPKEIQSAGR